MPERRDLTLLALACGIALACGALACGAGPSSATPTEPTALEDSGTAADGVSAPPFGMPGGTGTIGPDGSYNLVGYVILMYRCPPCPPMADCEQCLRDHVVISDDRTPLEGYARADDPRYVILSPPSEDLQLGRRYRLVVLPASPDPSGWPPIVGYVDTWELAD